MQTETLNGGTLETWTVNEVATALEMGEIVLVDIRSPDEHAQAHVEGAQLLPMEQVDADTLPTGDKRVVLMCGSGRRTGATAARLLGDGMDRIAHLDGGIMAWAQSGRPLVRSGG